MSVTSEEIKNIKFTTSFRGYKAREVDRFMSDICHELNQADQTNTDLLEKNQILVEKNEILLEQLSRYKEIEEMLNKTIVVAQETADNVKRNAKNEANQIVKEANVNADRIVSNAIERAQSVTADLEAVKSQTRIYKSRLKIMLEEQMSIVEGDLE